MSLQVELAPGAKNTSTGLVGLVTSTIATPVSKPTKAYSLAPFLTPQISFKSPRPPGNVKLESKLMFLLDWALAVKAKIEIKNTIEIFWTWFIFLKLCAR